MSAARQQHFIVAIATLLMCQSAAWAEPRIDSVRQALPEKARGVVDRIPEQGRKLLAIRSYLRSARSLEARWSWTQAEIDAYRKSDQFVSAMAAVAAVTKAFEVKNPGYTLHTNTEVRSLEEQVAKWNSNASVKSASDEIDAATTKWLADKPKAGPDDLRKFLVDWKPATTAMLAAPGLTAHGRGEAIDFQVADAKGVVVAGADGGAIATEWEGKGWGKKLEEAVRLSMMPFEGPLKDPVEPWHYDYEPPERSKLVVEEDKGIEPVASAPSSPEPAASAPKSPDPAAALPTVAVAVPVPVPAPRPVEAAPSADQKPGGSDEAKAGPSKPASVAKKIDRPATRKLAKKQPKASKKQIRRAKARKAKKRWTIPFISR